MGSFSMNQVELETELKEEIKPEVNNSFIKYYDNDEDDDFNLPSLK